MASLICWWLYWWFGSLPSFSFASSAKMVLMAAFPNDLYLMVLAASLSWLIPHSSARNCSVWSSFSWNFLALRLATSVLVMSLDTPSTTLFVERLAATMETLSMVHRFDLERMVSVMAWVNSWPNVGLFPYSLEMWDKNCTSGPPGPPAQMFSWSQAQTLSMLH